MNDDAFPPWEPGTRGKGVVHFPADAPPRLLLWRHDLPGAAPTHQDGLSVLGVPPTDRRTACFAVDDFGDLVVYDSFTVDGTSVTDWLLRLDPRLAQPSTEGHGPAEAFTDDFSLE